MTLYLIADQHKKNYRPQSSKTKTSGIILFSKVQLININHKFVTLHTDIIIAINQMTMTLILQENMTNSETNEQF